jgi:hypothetical protein
MTVYRHALLFIGASSALYGPRTHSRVQCALVSGGSVPFRMAIPTYIQDSVTFIDLNMLLVMILVGHAVA